MSEDRRPIGYWLKYLDRLIDDSFERTLASEDLTRLHWQALNTLRNRPSSRTEIADDLAPFLVGAPDAERQVIDDLVTRRWVESGRNDLLGLTEEGIQAQEVVLERVTATRQLLARGITEDEYRATIDVLRRMAENFERGADHEEEGTPKRRSPHRARTPTSS